MYLVCIHVVARVSCFLIVNPHTDNNEEEREQRLLERAKKRALSSSVIRELKDQYTDAPEEIREGRAYHMMQQGKEEQHR